jgi:hypothetical protein
MIEVQLSPPLDRPPLRDAGQQYSGCQPQDLCLNDHPCSYRAIARSFHLVELSPPPGMPMTNRLVPVFERTQWNDT